MINEKWESFALAPVDEPANPYDYHLFTAVSVECYLYLPSSLMLTDSYPRSQSDNNFLTTNGISLGVPYVPYNAGVNVSKAKLIMAPSVPKPSEPMMTRTLTLPSLFHLPKPGACRTRESKGNIWWKALKGLASGVLWV